MRTSEGLFAFINLSYAFGQPRIPTLRLLGFNTRGLYVKAGMAQPVIHARAVRKFDRAGPILSRLLAD